jgi:NTE family protein
MGRNIKQQRIGLVLSGGGARGFAHIGVMRVLERAGIQADVVAGTSIGAILGALYASGRSADEIYELAHETSWRDVFDLSLQAGLIKGDKLHAFLAKLLPPRFADLEKPFVITTTDIESGEEVVILEGDLVKAVRASSCFPGAFEPVEFEGRTLADGGIVNNLPVNAAAVFHASYTIASDATPPRRAAFREPHEQGRWWERMLATVRLERRNPMAQMLLRSSDIMQSILTDIQYNLHPADVRVQLDMPHIRIESFWAFEEIVKLGERAALRALGAAGLLPDDEQRHAASLLASRAAPLPEPADPKAKRRLTLKRP